MRKLVPVSSVLSKRAGGPSGYLANLLEGVKRIGNDEILITGMDQDEKLRGKSPGKLPLRSHLLAYMKRFLKRTLPAALLHRRLEKSRAERGRSFALFVDNLLSQEDYSVVHFHLTSDFHNFLIFSRNKKRSFACVLTSHSPIPAFLEEVTYLSYQGYSKPCVNKERILLEKRDLESFMNADYIVFPCEEATEGYFEWDSFRQIAARKKIKFVLSGVERLVPKVSAEQLRYKFSIPSSAFVVSYVGRHDVFKGYDILQKAAEHVWSRNENVWFLIAGKEWPIKGLRDKRWIEVGWTDDPASLINASDVFVLPNRMTFFDLVMLEVMSLGKIIIASNTGGNKFVAKQTRGVLLFENENEIDLAKKILDLSIEPNTSRQKMEKENLNTYEDCYTPELFARRYVALYDEIEKGVHSN